MTDRDHELESPVAREYERRLGDGQDPRRQIIERSLLELALLDVASLPGVIRVRSESTGDGRLRIVATMDVDFFVEAAPFGRTTRCDLAWALGDALLALADVVSLACSATPYQQARKILDDAARKARERRVEHGSEC